MFLHFAIEIAKQKTCNFWHSQEEHVKLVEYPQKAEL